MKQMPKVEKVMTTMPHTIGKSIPLKKALELMRTHQIRHLPVQEESHLVGILTDRDIKLASAFQGPGELTVEDVMTPDPFTVPPTASLDSVVEEMAEHKYGCAVVKQANGKVVGIFTAVDGLRYLSQVMREYFKQAG
jgi:acetoin utilization protein AcuB